MLITSGSERILCCVLGYNSTFTVLFSTLETSYFLLGKNKYYQCFKKLNVELLSLMRVEQAPVLREPWKRLALQL